MLFVFLVLLLAFPYLQPHNAYISYTHVQQSILNVTSVRSERLKSRIHLINLKLFLFLLVLLFLNKTNCHVFVWMCMGKRDVCTEECGKKNFWQPHTKLKLLFYHRIFAFSLYSFVIGMGGCGDEMKDCTFMLVFVCITQYLYMLCNMEEGKHSWYIRTHHTCVAFCVYVFVF